jgi:hypothetical protein
MEIPDMQIVIVGKRNEKPVIRWAGVIPLAVFTSLLAGLSAGGIHRIRSGQWDARSIMAGAFLGLLIVSFAVGSSLKTPLAKLRALE